MKINTSYYLPPIPMSMAKKVAWTATFDNYEPGDLVGEGPTEDEAIRDLRERFAERYDCQHDIDEQKADADSYTAVGHAAEVE